MEVIKIGNIYSADYTGGNFAGNVFNQLGLSPTISTFAGGGRQPHIVVKQQRMESVAKKEEKDS